MTKRRPSDEVLLFRFAQITICEQARRDFKRPPTESQIMDIVYDRVMWFESLPRFNPMPRDLKDGKK